MELKLVKEAIPHRVTQLARIQIQVQPQKIKYKSIQKVSFLTFRLKIKSSEKLSLGECGRQRTSKKFHDLVLSLGSQNSRVPEIIVFQALFSQRKVFNLLKWQNKSFLKSN